MLANLKRIVKNFKSDIILLIVILLVSLASFGFGYLVAKFSEKKPPLEIKYNYEKQEKNIK
ncbi:hypothetical protein J7K24_02275 [bacterium]|nr:hypothetical protein [bacterium]